MRVFSILCLVLIASVSAAPVAAHPGTGIVVDRSGAVFYTDLVHVWRIGPDGRKGIAVRDVHTHELAIDATGTIYGEDNRYIPNGERYRHRIWKRTPDGRVSDVMPWRETFWREYGFVKDSSGAMYWPTCPDRVCTIRKRTRDGRVSTLPMRRPFSEQINLVAVSPGGLVYMVEKGAVKVLHPDGSLRVLAPSVGESPMGVLPDGSGGLYVSVYHRRAVVHVNAAGRVTVVARSPEGWGPSAVAKAANGDSGFSSTRRRTRRGFGG